MKFYLLLFFLFVNIALARNWITQCIDLTINTKFDEAESLLTTRINNGDSSLDVYFYYASVLNSKMTHFENNKDQKKFYDILQRVIKQGQRSLKSDSLNNRKRAQILFYTGSAYGYLGFHQGQNKEWFSALRNGSSANKYLQQAVETDSTLWDAYLGLGAYKYWLSTKIHWIPFVPDERKEGIRLIKKTIEHNSYSRYMAMHQLVYILLDFGDYDQAEKIAGKMVEKYPESQFMYWAYSHVFMKKRDFPQAISAYKKLLQLINQDKNANPNHRITCLARMGDMYSRANNCQEANKVKLQVENDTYYITHNNDEVKDLLKKITERCTR